MSPNKLTSPVMVTLQSTPFSIVHGCPGVPRSIPRIQTTVQIRSVDGSPFYIRAVGAYLTTTQKVSIHATIGTNDAFKDSVIYKDPVIFRPPVGEFYQELIGLDIPLLIPLPKEIASSGVAPHWHATTIHKLFIKVSVGNSVENELNFVESFPVVVKCYDTLPLYRQFNEPVVEALQSGDKQVVAEMTIPNSSVGPGDEVNVYCKISTNTLNNKLKRGVGLKVLTLQLKEIIECFDAGLPPRKEHKIYTTTKLYGDKQLDSQGITEHFQFTFPKENECLELYSVKFDNRCDSLLVEEEVDEDFGNMIIEPYNIAKVIEIDKLEPGISLSHTQGFSTKGHFFTVKYEVILKVSLRKAKDMQIHLPITISPYDRTSSSFLLPWILHECDVARDKFGRMVVDQYCASLKPSDLAMVMNRFTPPPFVYRYIKEDWVRLGYNREAFGRSNNLGKCLVDYID
ncbi:uncharacterized protein J8A68_004211 [[Candida] subhashii]|uniref:Arrestin C-terminal-like domain-containing protein n=1 Tax=[Candida] subhashii TaxID=561895 RepID=A0A8J5QKK2_9ASCO|nr:uncharacterized protein J8A68_004211 [[Candida] subhashii]KAG7662317.1 hypothetical protein J8A68_004211 [[Candida] subhashii]